MRAIVGRSRAARRVRTRFQTDSRATMASLLDRKLLVVTGKGGVGKTTVAAALGLLAAERGAAHDRRRAGRPGAGCPSCSGRRAASRAPRPSCTENLWSISIDPDRALLEWLQTLGGRVSGRVLASSGTFQYFAAAAPGAKELVSMVKIWELTQGERWRRRARAAMTWWCSTRPPPDTRWAMLRSPQTFGAIARVGPIAAPDRQVQRAARGPHALGLSGGRARDRDGRHRDARAAGRPARAPRPRARCRHRQRRPASALHQAELRRVVARTQAVQALLGRQRGVGGRSDRPGSARGRSAADATLTNT